MGLNRGILLAAAALLFAAAMLPEVAAVRYIVGGKMGWSQSVNFTTWAQDIKFYNGDWLFFVYDRNQMNVLEVNKTDFESCNTEHPLHNWTTGAGRDVVPLNVTKTYYFVSGKGFCYGGMKVAIHVLKAPPPPSSAPIKSSSPPRLAPWLAPSLPPSFPLNLPTALGSRVLVPALFAVAAAWDTLLLLL